MPLFLSIDHSREQEGTIIIVATKFRLHLQTAPEHIWAFNSSVHVVVPGCNKMASPNSYSISRWTKNYSFTFSTWHNPKQFQSPCLLWCKSDTQELQTVFDQRPNSSGGKVPSDSNCPQGKTNSFNQKNDSTWLLTEHTLAPGSKSHSLSCVYGGKQIKKHLRRSSVRCKADLCLESCFKDFWSSSVWKKTRM
jgi:hypothetical protein